MRKHRDLIDQEANAINIAEAKSWRTQCLESITQWRAERASAIDNTEKERLSVQVRSFAGRSRHLSQECEVAPDSERTDLSNHAPHCIT